MNSIVIAQIFAIFGLTVVFVSFLIISKTMGGIGITLLRLEYLLSREYELVCEKERIKSKIKKMQKDEEEKTKKRDLELDPLLKIPFDIKKSLKGQ